MKVFVLRLGHRPLRDKRITTHVALTARAFGASGFVLAEVHDEGVVRSVRKVCNTWGGSNFKVLTGVEPVSYINEWKNEGGLVIHLTMYGLHVDDLINTLKSINKDLLIVVGAEKVPPVIYELANYNVAIGHQPHSEVSALAVFLDRLFSGRELHFIYSDAKISVVPTEKGKKVIRHD
ncbi:MAG: tRNA methyltransferase [Sulfolobales archaeon]|nr:tRNA methyltransferase [Sulfolobales archaeon]MCX8186292.1 tRNA methyltransferase [Sulfolobales archaeon]